jgi:hypothetical protein
MPVTTCYRSSQLYQCRILSHHREHTLTPTIEDCSDDEFDDEAYARGARYHRPYPGKNAGEPISNVRQDTPFETRLKEQQAKNLPIYHPFESMAEWELARWGMKNLGHGQMDSMLELEAVSGPVRSAGHRTEGMSSFGNAHYQRRRFGTHTRYSRRLTIFLTDLPGIASAFR